MHRLNSYSSSGHLYPLRVRFTNLINFREAAIPYIEKYVGGHSATPLSATVEFVVDGEVLSHHVVEREVALGNLASSLAHPHA